VPKTPDAESGEVTAPINASPPLTASVSPVPEKPEAEPASGEAAASIEDSPRQTASVSPVPEKPEAELASGEAAASIEDSPRQTAAVSPVPEKPEAEPASGEAAASIEDSPRQTAAVSPVPEKPEAEPASGEAAASIEDSPRQTAAVSPVPEKSEAEPAPGEATALIDDSPREQAAASAGAVADDARDPGNDSPSAKRKRARLEDRTLNCDVIELIGRAVGRWRLRGDERKQATDKAIDDVVRMTGEVRSEKFVFSGRVYGMLIYQIGKDHTPEGYGAYAQSACLILRGQKGIVPADDASQKRLDESLTICEAGSNGTGELNLCILERMERIVREQDTRSG
jgi:hypothetical protein